MFDSYLVNNRRKSTNWGNKWGRCTQRQNVSKLSLNVKSNWGISGVVTPKDKTLVI